MTKTISRLFGCFIVCFLTCFILIHPAISDESANEEIPLNQYGIRSSNPYVVDRFIEDGKLIDEIIVPSMPHPPEGFAREVSLVPEPDIYAGINTISNVPAMTWCFGCSATSAAMMFGHYDNTDYSNMYAGPTNGGVFPMTNEVWGTVVISGETRALCPLSATRLDLDERTTKGHVDDYWIKYGNAGPDPFIGNWTEHTYGECTGDYMGTNQSLLDNTDGSTTLYNYNDGTPLYDYTGCEPDNRDLCHGMRDFVESRGYTVQTLGNFNQYIYGYDGNTKGFTFDDFKTEIDAGRPVSILVEGHMMLGYGYNDTGSIIYIHDTWDYDDHEMTWGGSYSGMAHYAVSVLRLNDASSSMYVSQDGTCNGKSPCYTTIQAAVNAASTGTTIKIAGGGYGEDVSLSTSKNLTFKGGYDSTFTTQSSETTSHTMTISNGCAVVDKLTLTSAASSPNISYSGSDPYDYGTVHVGSSSNYAFTIQNTGLATLNISGASVSGTGFSVVGSVPSSISAGGSDTITVGFSPSSVGSHTGTLSINSDDLDTPALNIGLEGTGDSAPPEVANIVFYNNLVCGGSSFTATLTIDGQVLTSVSGVNSDCEEFDCGVSLNWSLYANTGGCGILTGSGSRVYDCDCLYEYRFLVISGSVYLLFSKSCPGDCSDVSSAFTGSMQLLDSVLLTKDADLLGLTVLDPLISE